MSDFSIPGVGKNDYNTEEMIKVLMDAKRIPLNRMNKELEGFGEEKKIWSGLQSKLRRLADSAKALYSFDNAFRDRTAISSNEDVLTATATREAIDDVREIVVQHQATADRLMSASLDSGYRPPAGRYTFRIGDKEIGFRFSGTTVTDFVSAVNDKLEDYLKASTVRDTPGTQVILLQSRKPGSANKLVFLELARDMGLATGMLAATDERSLTVELTPDAVKPWETRSIADTVVVETGTVTLRSGARARIAISPPFPLNENMVLEVEIRTQTLPQEPWAPPPPPPGPQLSDPGGLEFQGVQLRNEPSVVITPEYTKPQPPVVIEDMHILFFESAGALTALQESEVSATFQKIRVPIGEMADSINAINLQNRNSSREIQIRGIRLFDSTSRGDTRPLKPLSEAGDAALTVDGIPVTRPSNSIDDLIPGVTLELKGASATPVTLEISRNATRVKEAVITLVGYYNQVRTDIDILTRRQDSVVEDAYFESEDEREAARERLGALFGDSTLNMMRSTLSRIVMSSYPTSAGQELALLAQLGISTGSATSSSAIDKTRLRGYLDIDEEKLDAALGSFGTAVSELFGTDSDGDLVVDTGVAYEVERYVRGYVSTGGIIPQRLATLDTRIGRQNTQITRETTRLEDAESDLKREFAEMQGALQSLEDSSRRLEGLNSRND